VTQKKHNILALDSATKICSVALRNSENNVLVKKEKGLGIHSELLFVFIDEVLNEAGLTIDDLVGVVVTAGPGSYTGLRIAASAVKGLLFNRSVPLYGVNTLLYFAASAMQKDPELTRIHAVIDARRVHLYHQLFTVKNNELHPLTDVAIRKIDELHDYMEKGDGLIGTGIHRIPVDNIADIKILDDESIQASVLIDLYDQREKYLLVDESSKLIQQVIPEEFNPHYYNKSEPQVSKK